jgi:phage major head subunit gpT-like protein/phage head maturation protease
MTADILTFSASVELQAAADGPGKVPTVEILAYTGGAMKVPGWGDVAIDLAHLDASGQVAILVDHDASLQGIAGHGLAAIERGRLLVRGTIPPVTEAARQVVELSKAGFAFQASVGVMPERRERIEAGAAIVVNGQTVTAGSMGLTLIRAGKLKEVSLVALAADGETSVRVAASHKGTRAMSTNQQTNDTVTVTIPEELKCAWDRAGLSDGDRIEARLDRFRRDHGDVLPDFGRGMLRAAAAGSLTWADAEREILRATVNAMELRALRAEMPKGPAIHSSTRDNGGNPDAVLEGALLAHMGRESLGEKLLGAPVMQRARDLRCRSLLDVCAAAVMQAKGSVPHGTDAMLRAASTINAPTIFSNVANKILQETYTAFPSAARTIAKRLSSKDFKTATGVRLTGSSAFEELPPDGEIKHGHLTDASFTFRIATYAKMFSLDRTDIINDDLGAFNDLPALLARGAALKLEETFFALLLANASSFFGAGNGNSKTGAGSVLAIPGLTDAYQALLGMVDDQGLPIMAAPKFLLVPPALAVAAKALVASITTMTSGGTDSVVTPTANPLAGLAEVVVSPFLADDVLTNGSDKAWYLLCDPANVAAIGMAFLDNQESPTIESADSDFSKLGIQFRGYHDFGCVLIDPKGGVKSDGE